MAEEGMSWVKISQIRTLSTERIGKKIGTVFPAVFLNFSGHCPAAGGIRRGDGVH